MGIVQFKSDIDIELDQLDTPSLEQLLIQVRQILAHRQSPSLPKSEIELLQKINETLPDELQKQYNDLSAKMRSGITTPNEHQDLLKLIDMVELADVCRTPTKSDAAITIVEYFCG
jgi:hypothetical protein